MKALILAAGRGSRMGKLTESEPKCLVKLKGKTLLEWQKNSLRKAGIKDIALVRGYKGDLFKNMGLTLFDNPRWEKTNMVRSLLAASSLLEKHTCIVSYSDIFYSYQTISSLIQCQGHLSIAYDPDWLNLWGKRFSDPLSDAETFRFNSEKFLLEIGGKTSRIQDIQGQYMGLLKFDPKVWEQVLAHLNSLKKEVIDQMDMTSLLASLLKNQVSIQVVARIGPWGEVDSAYDLELYENL